MEKELRRLQFIASVLDARFEILGIRFGINTLFQFIPGMGDFIAGVLSFYIISAAVRMGVPSTLAIKMILNVGMSIVAGLVPLLGDIFYLAYKPNMKNVTLLKHFLTTSSRF